MQSSGLGESVRRLVAVLLGLSLSTAGAATSQEAPTTPESSLESRIDAVFADYDTTRSPGCSLGVVERGELTLARGYGMANLEHGIPLSAESVFRIGSTSKQFTAASIVLLSLDGKLGLDDDLRRYLPELPRLGDPVTIRHLVHHTSGYRDYLTLMALAGKGDADYYSDEDLLRILARQEELNFRPGDEHLYSNSGYWLLSQVVLRITGASMRDFAPSGSSLPWACATPSFTTTTPRSCPTGPAATRRPSAAAMRSR